LFPTALFDGIEKLLILLVAAFLFWLQRLLAFFERGEYFSNQSVTCCQWLAWMFVVMLVIPATQKGYLYYLCYRFLPDLDIRYSIEVNLSSLVLVILLPMIIYMLRIAQTLELENKEFV
jgi:NADH:ubiquinone oxidoreductase subunit 4 (subunit M)